MLRTVRRELAWIARAAADSASFRRYAADLMLARLLRERDTALRNKTRRIRLRGGVTLTYRPNWGDMDSIREVWVDELYRLPFKAARLGVVIDLGANIGMTGVWLAKRYGCSTVLAVEPSPENARLARRNLTDNGVSAQVVEAAVGPEDGTARFKEPKESNQGRVADSGNSDEGYEVRMASVASLLGILAHNGCAASIDLVKMDIEGSEEQVFSGDLNWLQHVRSLIVEFHPWLVDPGSLRAAVENKGFRHIPADAAYGGSPEAFVRRDDGSRGLPGTEAPSPGA